MLILMTAHYLDANDYQVPSRGSHLQRLHEFVIKNFNLMARKVFIRSQLSSFVSLLDMIMEVLSFFFGGGIIIGVGHGEMAENF